MNQFTNSKKFLAVMCAVIVIAGVGREARGELAYLPVCGAPPMRMLAASTNHAGFDLISYRQAAKALAASNALTLAAAQVAAATNSALATKTDLSSNANASPPPTVPGATNVPASSLISIGSSSSASDLLTVTPTMIVEYLKKTGATNNDPASQPGAVVFVPAGIQFTPPTPKVSGESQATYKIQ